MIYVNPYDKLHTSYKFLWGQLRPGMLAISERNERYLVIGIEDDKDDWKLFHFFAINDRFKRHKLCINERLRTPFPFKVIG